MSTFLKLKLPSDWEIRKLKEVCSINPENLNIDNYSRDFIDYIDISSINNEVFSIEKTKRIPIENIPSRARRIVRTNDVIISTVRPYLKAFAKISKEHDGKICSTGFAVLRSFELIRPNYLFHWIFSQKFLNFLISNMVGSNYPAVNTSDVKVAPVLLPPLHEQIRIATILDNIDNLIQTTRQLIEKLHLLKKGLMQKLFTEGIGHTEFKDTKLGRIPKEWDVKKLSQLVKINPVYPVPEQPDYAYLPMDAIDKERMDPNYWERRTKEDLTTTRFKNGDILFAKITPSTEHGKGALIQNFEEKIGFGSTELVVLSPQIDKVNSEFLFYTTKIESFRYRAVQLMEGATGRQRVPRYFFKSQLVVIPSFEEQSKIASVLLNIDNQIANERRYLAIQKLTKKGLMQELLTGKKRVPLN